MSGYKKYPDTDYSGSLGTDYVPYPSTDYTAYPGTDYTQHPNASWTPLSASAALWLDGADAAYKTLNGAAVSAWLDKSGNARNATQADPTKQPANVSGTAPTAGVDFADGTNVLALASALSLGTSCTIALVVTGLAAASNTYLWADGSGSDGFLSGFSLGGDLEWFNTGGGTDRQKFVENPTTGTRYQLVLSQSDGASLVGRVNGVQAFSVVPAIALSTLQFIGAANAAATSGCSQKLHELAVFAPALDAAGIASLETYLARWA